MSEPLCICEHEPHDGECTELVRSIIGPPWPCGCDEYCPDRGFWACVDGASYGPFESRAEADEVRAGWCESWTEPLAQSPNL